MIPTSRPDGAHDLESIRDDVYLLLDHAVSQTDIVLDEALITRIAAAAAVEPPLTPAQEGELLACYQELSKRVAPATSDSIRTIQGLLSGTRDSGAGQIIRASVAWILAMLVVLVPIQIYASWLAGSLAQMVAATAELDTLVVRQAELQESIDALKDQPEASRASLEARMDEVQRAIDIQDGRATAAAEVLDLLTPDPLVSVPTEKDAAGNDTKVYAPKDIAALRIAASGFVEAVALYIVPLLYGLLGANVYVLRYLLNRLDSWSLTEAVRPKLRLRRALGALLGASVGLLYTTGGSDSLASAGFSLALLAFLAGYSAEFIFSIFDTLIERGKAAVSGEPAKGR